MLPANWLKSHFFSKTEIMWRVQPLDGGICRPVYSVTTRWKAVQKNEGWANNHRGALEFIRWLLARCQEKGHQRLSRVNNSRQQWLFPPLFFCFVRQWHETFSSHSIWLPLTLPVSWELEVKDTTAASFVSKQPSSSRAWGGMGEEGGG